MTATTSDDALTQVLRKTIQALVRRDEADLTSRQFGVFLTVYRPLARIQCAAWRRSSTSPSPPSPVPWTG
jgi:hypothetical protein